jgi:hypothetical protein
VDRMKLGFLYYKSCDILTFYWPALTRSVWVISIRKCQYLLIPMLTLTGSIFVVNNFILGVKR